MTRLCLELDALAKWRESVGESFDLGAVATLVDLAGGDCVRLCVSESLQHVSEADLQRLVQTCPQFELCMPPSQSLLRLMLEVRPSRVILVEEDRYGSSAYGPLDLRKADSEVAPIVRALEEADLPVAAVVAPEVDAVKMAHGVGLGGLELYARYAADLPEGKRGVELERLCDASLLATKLRFDIGLGGGLDYRNVVGVLNAVPNAGQVTVGRSVWRRALMVGVDRAVRDFRALIS